MDNLIDRAKFNISQFRGSEDGQLPDDLYVTNMLKRSGKNVSDMDRQMIMKMLSEGMPKEMVMKLLKLIFLWVEAYMQKAMK